MIVHIFKLQRQTQSRGGHKFSEFACYLFSQVEFCCFLGVYYYQDMIVLRIKLRFFLFCVFSQFNLLVS